MFLLNYCCLLLITANWVQLILLITAILTVILGYKAIREGQKQSKQSLRIGQYNIYYKELEGIINSLKSINFKKNLEKYNAIKYYPKKIIDALEDANGINESMIILFDLFISPDDKERTKDQEIYFMTCILRPLIWEYEHLLHFLNSIIQDDILNELYKNMFYEKVEYDILQSYLRVCNNKKLPIEKPLDYDLTCFPSQWHEEFYKINYSYIKYSLFRFKNLDFYRNTL